MKLDQRYTLFTDEAWELNPMQELIVPHMEHEDNVLIIGKTSSGKSTAVPMLGTKHLDEGYRILYTAPFKSIVEEKRDDWDERGCPWRDLPKTAISGDYVYDEAKLEEIRRAALISITPESLLAMVRNQKQDRAQILPEVGTIFVDELHLVTEDGRGSALETALIELLTDYPEIRLVGMSGTIINYEEIMAWMTRLNGRETHLVKSDYRPVVLQEEFYELWATGKATNREIINLTWEIVNRDDKKEQQFMVVCFNKNLGKEMQEEFASRGLNWPFHSADIRDLCKRKQIERSFKNKAVRGIICTTTLSTGVNLPATNVIASNCEWNGGEDIPAHLLQQIAGRAGRPRYDTEGFVHFFVKGKERDRHEQRIKAGERIESRMRRKEVVAEHFLGALYLQRFHRLEDFDKWYHKTLAYVQGDMNEDRIKALLTGIVDDMKLKGMIRVDDVTGEITLKKRGVICAQMMLDPYWFGALLANFNVFYSLTRPTDLDIARAIGRVPPFYSQWVTKEEKDAIPEDVSRSRIEPEYHKHCGAIYIALQGRPVPGPLSKAWWDTKDDLDRYGAALVRACTECEMWQTKEYDASGKQVKVSAEDNLRLIFLRVKRSLNWAGARKAVEGFTRSEIKKLNSLGIVDREDARKNMDLVRKVIRDTRLRELNLVS